MRQRQDCWGSCGWAGGQVRWRYPWVSVSREHQPQPLSLTPTPQAPPRRQTGAVAYDTTTTSLAEGEGSGNQATRSSPRPCGKAREGCPILQMRKRRSKRTEAVATACGRDRSWGQCSHPSRRLQETAGLYNEKRRTGKFNVGFLGEKETDLPQ